MSDRVTAVATEHGVRALSRQAMVDRAIVALAAEPRLPLSAMAARIGVSRSSLYRHFSDQATLLEEVRRECGVRVVGAYVAADLARGTAGAALGRLAENLFALGPVLSLVFADEPVVGDLDEDDPEDDPEHEQTMAALVQRGYADGTIASGTPADWVETLLWTTLLAGHQHAERPGVQRSEALGLLLAALRGGLAAVAA